MSRNWIPADNRDPRTCTKPQLEAMHRRSIYRLVRCRPDDALLREVQRDGLRPDAKVLDRLARTELFQRGRADGAAVERGEKGGYRLDLFLDHRYRHGLQRGRRQVVDEVLRASAL